MPLIERYILRRTTQAFLFTLAALIATLWVTQVLRELDVVTAKGQAIWVFLVMTVLALPALVQVVAPIAFLVGAIMTLNALNNDSELPVISGAGGSRAAVNRPILVLALLVMLVVAVSHHVLAPASLTALHGLVTRMRAEVIATLVQDGGFRRVDDRLTVHIREKAPDGTFQGIFVSDERDPNESLQYSAAQGMLLERAGGSFLVLQDGHLIRASRIRDEDNVVAFETYALDLSQVGAPNAAALYKAKERSTLYLLEPEPGDPVAERYPERLVAEIHERMTAPLYAPAFALIALAFLGRPSSHRQSRLAATTAVVVLSLLFRAAGFAAVAIADGTRAAIPAMYVIPLAGILLGAYGARQTRFQSPAFVEAAWDRAARLGEALTRRVLSEPRVAGTDQP